MFDEAIVRLRIDGLIFLWGYELWGWYELWAVSHYADEYIFRVIELEYSYDIGWLVVVKIWLSLSDDFSGPVR